MTLVCTCRTGMPLRLALHCNCLLLHLLQRASKTLFALSSSTQFSLYSLLILPTKYCSARKGPNSLNIVVA